MNDLKMYEQNNFLSCVQSTLILYFTLLFIRGVAIIGLKYLTCKERERISF